MKLNHPIKGAKTSVDPIRNPKDIEAIRRLLKEKPRDLLLFTLGINNGLRVCDLMKLTVGQVRDLKVGQTIQIKETYENILKVYPQLMEEDIQACLKYAAKLATEEVVYESKIA